MLPWSFFRCGVCSAVSHGAALLTAMLMLSGCAGARGPSTNLPDLELESIDGRSWNLQQESGRIVVLQFFATFDNSSIALSTALEQLHFTYRQRGVSIIGVAMDPPNSPRRRELVETFCGINNISFDVQLTSVALSEGETAVGRIPAIPATVIFNRDGDPVASVTGVFRRAELAELLEAMIEERAHPLLQRTH